MKSIDKCHLTARSKVSKEKHVNLLVSKRMFILVLILCSAVFIARTAADLPGFIETCPATG